MRNRLIAITLLTLTAAPVGAQVDAGQIASMTCGEFLALDPAERMTAMLDLRAAASGETITEEQEVEDATVLTGATAAGATGGLEGGPDTLPQVDATPEARQRLSGMRTSCEGAPEVPVIDAMTAAHADYDPILEDAPVSN